MMKSLIGKIFDKNYSPDLVKKDGQEIEVIIKKNSRAKNMRLKICSKTRMPLVTVPKYVSKKRALDFAFRNFDWIKQKIKTIPDKRYLTEGEEISVLGKSYKIISTNEKIGGAKIVKDVILVSGHKEHIPRRVKDLLKIIAKKETTKKANFYADKLNKKIEKITIKDTKTRWGSCSAKNNLNFSWRLVLAPVEILDYVVAHEVCHLVEMNHSKKFKNLLESIFPDYKLCEKWLKQKGQELHAYE